MKFGQLSDRRTVRINACVNYMRKLALKIRDCRERFWPYDAVNLEQLRGIAHEIIKEPLHNFHVIKIVPATFANRI